MEIVLQIVPLLTAHDHTQLVLVCKSWYTLFIPHLYDHVMLPLNDYCDPDYGHVSSSLDLPVRRFTVALIENPTLTLLVHSLEFYPGDCEGKWQKWPPLKPLAEEKYRLSMLPHGDSKRKHHRKFRAWRRDLKHRSERQDWYRPYRYEDAWLALLCVQVKDLEKLSIQLPEEWDHLNAEAQLKTSVHFERVIHWASNPKLGILTRLSHLSSNSGPAFLDVGTAVNALPLNRLIPFLRIPSLRKLYAVNACDRSRFAMPRDLVLPLTHLDLHAPIGRLPNLRHLLERCPYLQSFTHEQSDDWEGVHSHDCLDFSALYRPLLRSRSSLRHLNITFRSYQTWQDAEIPTPAFFGSLAEFPNLQSVHMRWGNLMPFLGKAAYDSKTPLRELLPCSLRHLYIEDCLIQCSSKLCKELENLLIHFSETVPLLKTLYLRYALVEQVPGQGCIECVRWSEWREMKPDPTINGHLLELQEKALTLGVNFRVIKPEVTAPFPQDHIIRKEWPQEVHGKFV